MKGFSLLSLGIFLSLNAVANIPKTVHVEILVFETQDKDALAEEWPIDPGKPSLTKAFNLALDPAADLGQLADNQLTLQDTKRRLQKRYHLVLHQGWRQPLTHKDNAPKIHLVGGKRYTHEGKDVYEVDGTITLSTGPSMHASADLLFHKPMRMMQNTNPVEETVGVTTPTTAKFSEINPKNHSEQENARLQAFRLKESTRVRSQEIHYIDHPLYGVIILVTPEKIPS